MSEVKNQVREALEPFAKAAAVWRSAGEAALMMCGPNDVHDLGEEYSEAGWMASMPDIKLIHLVAAEDALAAISHPAPDVPSSEEIDAIRARHEADSGFESDGMDSAEWRAALTMLATRAHTDRATLLRLLDAAREELAKMQKPSIQWDPDNPEVPINSVEDLAESFVDYGHRYGVFAVDNAHVLPSTYHYFEAGIDDDTGNVGETYCIEITKDEYNGARAANAVGWFAKKAKWHTERLAAALKDRPTQQTEQKT
jgi:hypothetical protein